jgi:hypothetical protein
LWIAFCLEILNNQGKSKICIKFVLKQNILDFVKYIFNKVENMANIKIFRISNFRIDWVSLCEWFWVPFCPEQLSFVNRAK